MVRVVTVGGRGYGVGGDWGGSDYREGVTVVGVGVIMVRVFIMVTAFIVVAW